MDIEVWFFGQFRELAGRKRAINLDNGAPLSDLIECLLKEYGIEMSKQIKQAEGYFIMINGYYCEQDRQRKKPLKDGDVVAFIPIITGG